MRLQQAKYVCVCFRFFQFLIVFFIISHQGYIADGSQYGEKAKSVVQDMDDPWSPTTMTAFKLLMSARLCAALWNIVTDCDETYNYWESVWDF